MTLLSHFLVQIGFMTLLAHFLVQGFRDTAVTFSGSAWFWFYDSLLSHFLVQLGFKTLLSHFLVQLGFGFMTLLSHFLVQLGFMTLLSHFRSAWFWFKHYFIHKVRINYKNRCTRICLKAKGL